MRIFKNIAGIFVVLLGALWILQGITGMPMSGNREWLVLGAIAVAFGLGLLYQNNRPVIDPRHTPHA